MKSKTLTSLIILITGCILNSFYSYGQTEVAAVNFTTNSYSETGWTSFTSTTVGASINLDNNLILTNIDASNITAGEWGLTGGGIIPDNVIKTYHYIGSNDNSAKNYRVSGLSTSTTYNFEFFASRSGTGDDRTTHYTIGSTTVSINADQNPGNSQSILYVSPNASGEIIFTIQKDAAASYGYINALRIYDAGGTPPTEYQLTVINGTGGGMYEAGESFDVSANNTGQTFIGWTGDISYINDPASANTSGTMPAQAISLTATYESSSSSTSPWLDALNSGIYYNGNVGIGISSPTAKLDVGEPNFTGNALRLRAGDSYDYDHGANQILFSWYGTCNYTHAIKSRHHSGRDRDNALDFFVWDYGTDGASDIGSKLVMSLNANKVGIGTANPSKTLSVIGDGYFTGNVGIGTETPGSALGVHGSLKLMNTIPGLGVAETGIRFISEGITDEHEVDESKLYGWDIIADASSHKGYLKFINGSKIYTSGEADPNDDFIGDNIAFEIGPYFIRAKQFNDLDAPGYYLDPGSTFTSLKAKGKIITESKIECTEMEVLYVDCNSIKSDEIVLKAENMADYVFKEDYNLRPLEELEQYIEENHHLPNLPSAKEFEQQGMNVAEMNNLLLQKIEELTLYVIELKKENLELNNKLENITK